MEPAEQLTAERFVRYRSSGLGQRRFAYRTGDLVKYLPDGRMDFLGRLDHQVKIRGHRIELGEIEAALGQHPDVKEAVVTAADDRIGGKVLVAHIVTRSGDAVAPAGLRQFLASNLPAYMVPAPSRSPRPSRLPPTAKSTAALWQPPKQSKPCRKKHPPPPPTKSNAGWWRFGKICWTRAPSVPTTISSSSAGIRLLITRLSHRIQQEFGKQLSMAEVFQAQTIEGMAASCERPACARGSARSFMCSPPDRGQPSFAWEPDRSSFHWPMLSATTSLFAEWI